MNNPKGFIPIIVVVFIAVIGAGVVAAAWYYNEHKDEVATTNTNTTKDGNILYFPLSESQKTSCLDNGGTIKEMRAPAFGSGPDSVTEYCDLDDSKTITNTSTNTATNETAGWTKYTDEKYGYSFKHPSDWSIDQSRSSDNVVVFNIGNTSGEGRESIEVKTTTQTTDAWAASFDSAVVATTSGVTIDGQSGKRVDTTEFALDYVGVRSGNYLFIFTSNSGELIADSVLTTFNFKDETAGWQTYTDNADGWSIKYPEDWTTSNALANALQILPPDAEQKTQIELGPSIFIKKVQSIPEAAPQGTQNNEIPNYDCNQNRTNVQVGKYLAIRQDESCFATFITTYIQKNQEYIRISWPEVFQDDYSEYEEILSTFQLPD